MQVIALTGLVMAEKLDLTVELAQYAQAHQQSVTVINNVHYPPLDSTRLGAAALIDITKNISAENLAAQVIAALPTIADGVVLLPVSEMIPPDPLFMALEDIRDSQPKLDLRILALVDAHSDD